MVVISLLVLLLSFIKRNEFTGDLSPLPELNSEPLQTATNKAAFSTTYNDEPFEIMPKYNYELYGLVVSYRLHDATGGMMLHALSKDHLNVADFCVVWGTAADPELLREFDFSNGQFSCQYGTQSHTAWNAFNDQQLSNNHLLAIKEEVRDTIKDIKIGDQIKITGWLSHYKNPLGYERGTSITRTDRGDGACETILVDDISILQPMNSVWRKLMWLSLGLFILSLFIYLKAPFAPYKS